MRGGVHVWVRVALGSNKWPKRAKNTQIPRMGAYGQPFSLFHGVGVHQRLNCHK